MPKSIVNLIRQLYKNLIIYVLSKRDPRISANRSYSSKFGKKIDWNNPADLIEKIYWLEIYSDTSLWSICADKFRMRQYVKSKGCGSLLPRNYGHWQKAEDINYNILPNEFVLKTTNGCGQVLIVKNKRKLNIKKTNATLNKWMKIKYGFTDAQIHYSRIRPCIIAEEYLIDKTNPEQSYLTDFKVWCFHGKPEFILVVYDRTNSGYKLSTYDLKWNNTSNKTLKRGIHYGGDPIRQPATLKEMIKYASLLSEDFLEVRVDFYEIDGKLYLGELTFSTGYGYYTDDYYKYLGSKINLNKAKQVKNINKPVWH